MKRSMLFTTIALIFSLTFITTGCGDDGDGGNTGIPEITDSTAPGIVTITGAVVGGGSITVTWTDPSDSDLASVYLTWQNSSMADPIGNTVNKGAQTYTIPDLGNIETEYTITITAKDGADNKSGVISFKVHYTPTAATYHFIYTAADFNAIRGGEPGYATWDLTGCYVLMADISISGYYLSSGTEAEGWGPLGTSSGNPFTGTFEGNGHTISGLAINRSANYQGLFGYISSTGIVKDLSVSGTVNGLQYVGGLAGSNEGKITNCSSNVIIGTAPTKSVAPSNYSFGGLVGQNYGTITGCHSTGAVYGSVDYVGGLIGYNNGGTIVNSYSTGNVNGGTYNYVGGLVGRSLNGTITGCHATGNVTGTRDYIGGLVGSNYYVSSGGTITNCYATGSVNGSATGYYHGGLTGSNNGGTITTSYSTGTVTGGSNTGGLCGINTGVISKCYYYFYSAGSTYSVEGGENTGGLAGVNTGTISDSFASGVIKIASGCNSIGGFAGSNSNTITNSYFSGTVDYASGGSYLGAFVGYDTDGTYTSCYYDSSKTGSLPDSTDSVGNLDLTDVDQRTTAEMLQQTASTIYVSWNTSATWTIATNSYPHLTGMPNPYLSDK